MFSRSSRVADAVYRVVRNGRLEYYRKEADSSFWDAHWDSQDLSHFYNWAEQGRLGFHEKTFPRWLPPEGRVLEAGCGLGQFVLALRKRGWDAEGVEWGEKTVEYVNRRYPDLPIRRGDVTKLDVPDDRYMGYISLGVVEHRREGPTPFLKEAYRILAPGGVALIAVPYFNVIRQVKARLGFFSREHGEYEFYQYAFTKNEFSKLVASEGFAIVRVYRYNVIKCLEDELGELPLVGAFVRRCLALRLTRYLFRKCLRQSALFGHMQMVVARKPAE